MHHKTPYVASVICQWPISALLLACLNSLRLRQNGRCFPDDIFKCFFLTDNVWILINISLKFVPKGQINNIPALVQIMAWCRPDDKPLSEPMMVRLAGHICVTWPQWTKKAANQRKVLLSSYVCEWCGWSFFVMSCVICCNVFKSVETVHWHVFVIWEELHFVPLNYCYRKGLAFYLIDEQQDLKKSHVTWVLNL